MRGRKPTPTYLKIIRGNPGCRPINKDEPQPLDGLPPLPTELTGKAKDEWDRATNELRVMGGLKTSDMAVIAMYAHAWSIWCAIMDRINKRPDPFWTEQTDKIDEKTGKPVYKVVPSPLIRELRHAEAHLLRFASELGFSPAVRSRMRVEGVMGHRIDDLEDIVSKPRKLKAV